MAALLTSYWRDASPIFARPYPRLLRFAGDLLSSAETSPASKLEMRWSKAPDGRLVARWLPGYSIAQEQFAVDCPTDEPASTTCCHRPQ